MARGDGRGRVVPASRVVNGTPVFPAPLDTPGHVAVDFSAVDTCDGPEASTTSGMTTDHPAFGGPASAATKPLWTP
jgi:hypothetical protein